MEWQAKWIWDHGESNPRNHWLSFRKKFYLSEIPDEALLYITADSRYFAYVNGCFLGIGPVRGWPAEPFYDTYDVKDLLISGGENVLAILVTHYGVSTFQYIEGRGGLLAQLELIENMKIENICSNHTWNTHIHSGYGRSAERISCQLPWTEIYDANKINEVWIQNGFDASSWDDALEIGEVGMLPWLVPQKRDIPLLREEAKYPMRIEWARKVRTRGKAISLDLQPNLFPGQLDANPKSKLAYIATVIYSPIALDCTIHFPWDNWLSTYGSFRINNQFYEIPSNRKVTFHLTAGESFFLMDISGTSHLSSAFFHIDSAEVPLVFTTPGYASSGFVTLGPFFWEPILQIGILQNTKTTPKNEFYEQVGRVVTWKELHQFSEWLQPITDEHSCLDNIFMYDIHKDILEELAVSQAMQALVIPNQSYFSFQLVESEDMEFMLDFGQEVSGYIQFEIDAPEGTIVDFCGAERIIGNKTEPMDGMNNTLRYIASEGKQTYRSVVRRGFRYLSVTLRNASRAIKMYGVYIQLSTYPSTYIGQFTCSDWKLNRIWDISRDTTLLCMEDTFVDCPAYEQTFWVGDARNVALINYYTFGSYDLVRRSLRLVAKSLQRSPVAESQVPSGWQNVLSAWSLFWVAACKEYYDFTADLDFIKEIYPALNRNLQEFISRLDPNGLVSIRAWNILEWAPMDTPEKGNVTHLNASLVSALHAMESIAYSLGYLQDADKWIKTACKIKQAINDFLWDDRRQAYVDCLHENGEMSNVISMQTNVMVYLSECAEGERKSRLEQYLQKAPEAFVQIHNPFMLFFYYEALTRIGKGEQMIQSILEQWGKMIDQGATTCWETISRPDNYHPTRSYCHAWSSAPAYYLGSHVLGVRPLSPGFTKILIDPLSNELLWAKGSVPIPHGRIDVAWEKTEAGIRLRYSAPPEIEIILGNKVMKEEWEMYGR